MVAQVPMKNPNDKGCKLMNIGRGESGAEKFPTGKSQLSFISAIDQNCVALTAFSKKP